MSGPLLFWACFWVAVLCVVALSANVSSRRGPLLLVLGVATAFCFLSGLVLMFLMAVAIFVIAAVWPPRLARPFALPLTCAAVIAAMSSSAVLTALERKSELAEWRKEFAFRSTADRLGYEQQAGREAPKHGSLALAPQVEARLTAFEQRSHRTMRTSMLQRLHDDTRNEFELLTGFGPIRMMNLRRRDLELPPTPQVPQPSERNVDSVPDPHFTSFEAQAVRGVPPQDELLPLHDSSLYDFLDPERMGYVVDREHVAGFASHQFSSVPQAHGANSGAARWGVRRLELIGLMSHPQPVVYVSEFLPNLEELGDDAVRALDEFEQEGLVKLRESEDVVIADSSPHIRMLGAVRATESCRQCHQVERGELLGAFSYVLAPSDASHGQSIAAVK